MGGARTPRGLLSTVPQPSMHPLTLHDLYIGLYFRVRLEAGGRVLRLQLFPLPPS